MYIKNFGLFLAVVIILLPACRNQQEPAFIDSQEAEHLYSMIETQHDSIMARYHRLGEVPAEVQQHYDEMERLYGEAMPMYHGMMGRGRMGRMMTDEGYTDWGHMHSMHRQLHDLHSETADELHAHGYDEMARMHEQMLEYYDQALELSGAEQE